MQQTEKRGFNIIETSDAFSPEALNDNTLKLEAALDAHEAAVKTETDALDARVTVLEGIRFACGSYLGDKVRGRHIDLPFRPLVVFMQHYDKDCSLRLRGLSEPLNAVVDDTGFTLTNDDYNNIGMPYLFFAIGDGQ